MVVLFVLIMDLLVVVVVVVGSGFFGNQFERFCVDFFSRHPDLQVDVDKELEKYKVREETYSVTCLQ